MSGIGGASHQHDGNLLARSFCESKMLIPPNVGRYEDLESDLVQWAFGRHVPDSKSLHKFKAPIPVQKSPLPRFRRRNSPGLWSLFKPLRSVKQSPSSGQGHSLCMMRMGRRPSSAFDRRLDCIRWSNQARSISEDRSLVVSKCFPMGAMTMVGKRIDAERQVISYHGLPIWGTLDDFRLGLSILDDAEEIAKEDDDGDFADGGDVNGSLFLDFWGEVLYGIH